MNRILLISVLVLIALSVAMQIAIMYLRAKSKNI